jgi:hypothetical protein
VTRRPFVLAALLLLTLGVGPLAIAQDAPPDRRGEAWQPEPESKNTYRGVRASVPIPVDLRQRNTRGTDGGGICVVASATTNGRYQGIGDEVQKLWEYAKTQPGGHSPQKLEAQIKRVAPSLKYANYLGHDAAVLERLCGAGYPVGATMNTGRQYNYARIAHMVSLTHFNREQNLAAVVDNNQPEVTAWMPATEFERRWSGGGSGWVFVWDYDPEVAPAVLSVAVFAPLAVIVYLAGVALTIRRIRTES